MSSIQPLKLWSHWGAPNPWKVIMILDSLSLPYDLQLLEFSDVKKDEFIKVTPNGRLPALEDPNTGIVLWESGAIILYLIEQYDTEEKISYKSFPEKHLTQQWLAFQISGQGPYFGQATYFARFHPDPLPSAITRYLNEIIRVVSVLDLGLQRNGTGWLVGSKCTYADLSFRTWAAVGEGLLAEVGRIGEIEKFERYRAWIGSMDEVGAVKWSLEKMAEGRREHGLK
ncbi:thioredoxin-like protein [Phaeosphaeria sp. MPI-PUGE-AT-0046c]|nr:thioredoxin-like protein [Phaeosphaeria sp. MPI-PUGE-AT-0046c]